MRKTIRLAFTGLTFLHLACGGASAADAMGTWELIVGSPAVSYAYAPGSIRKNAATNIAEVTWAQVLSKETSERMGADRYLVSVEEFDCSASKQSRSKTALSFGPDFAPLPGGSGFGPWELVPPSSIFDRFRARACTGAPINGIPFQGDVVAVVRELDRRINAPAGAQP